MSKFRLFCICLIVYLLVSVPVYAEWSTNPNLNLQICDLTNDQVTPKIAPASDGGCYITWFDLREGGYRVYIQRLDAAGNFQFQADGLLVSNHLQDTWITDYDLITDDQDNAVVVFSDIRNGNLDVFTYRVSPQGDMLWGADGIPLSVSSEFEASPKVAQMSDGDFVFVWPHQGQYQTIRLQRLSPNGDKLWGDAGLEFTGVGQENLTWPDVIPANDGSAIVLWTNYTGPFWSPTTNKIYTQKLSPAGAAQWFGIGVQVFSLTGLPGYTEPHLTSDGNSGAIVSWHDDRNNDNLFSAYVQRITPNGQLVFPANGVELSTRTGRHHFYPDVVYDAVTQNLYAFWSEENPTQSQFGVYGQMLSPTGERRWTNNGKTFIEVGVNEIGNILGAKSNNGIYVSYFVHYPGSYHVESFLIDLEGAMAWTSPISLAMQNYPKLNLYTMVNIHDVQFLVWEDERNDGGIYAQNVNPDGTLGYQEPIQIEDNDDHAGQMPLLLGQSYPNPAKLPEITIPFTLPEAGRIELKIFTVTGQFVATLIDQRMPAGDHQVNWRADHAISGQYYYRLKFGNFQETKKFTLTK